MIDIFKILIIAMTPVLELRGAIPIGVASGINIYLTILISIIGNLIPVPFILLFIKSIFKFIRKYFNKLSIIVDKLEKRASEKSDIVHKYEMLGLMILVAVPLPGTGAWTGSLVAALLNMPIKKAFPPIAGGVIIAAFIVSIITYGVTIFI